MRVGLALSSLVHLGVLLVAFLALAAPKLFEPTPPEMIAVDIVPDEEAPAKPETPQIELPKDRLEPKPDSAASQKPASDSPGRPKAEADRPSRPKAEASNAAPAESPTGQPTPQSKAQASSTPASAPGAPSGAQAQAGQQMAAMAPPPQPDPFAPDATPQPLYFPVLKNVEQWAMDYEFDAVADQAAALTRADIAAFREHLEKCWKPPASLAQAQRLQAVLRISLTPDGAMAAEPILVKASASAQGPALVDTARRALTACQPFRFLPADKHSEWKVLDLSFTPQGLGG
jgi:outer membrane biosynthesis protein TonB